MAGTPQLLKFRLTPQTRLVLQKGDLTRYGGDAIVNAANERMLGGGGVDGAIHRAAGPRLLEECRKVPEVRPGVRCPTGEARITPGANLPARFVIHTVGPVYSSDQASAPLLASAYRSSLRLANEKGIKTIAFPAISCGVFGYPYHKAAKIAIDVSKEEAGSLAEVQFVLFQDELLDVWRQEAEAASLERIQDDEKGEGAHRRKHEL
ncbi:hypothetical protein N2152v2_010465 [Parachlorella kessleri]